MSNTSLNLIDFNTSASQQTITTEDTSLAAFHHRSPPTPLPQKQQKTPNYDELSEENDQDGIPLTAAGLTRAMETNQGHSLTEIINIATTNPSHLFWVPASQHPELAPTEFEKYVVALRANAKDKGKVKRRRSVLSQSFTAADNEMRNEGDTTTSILDGQQNGDKASDDDNELWNSSNKEGERLSALGALENKHHQHVVSLGRSNSLQSMGEMNDNNPHLSSAILESNINNNQHIGKKDQEQSVTNKHATKARKERLRRSMSLHLPGNTDTGRIPDFLVFDRNSTALDQSPVLVPKTDRPLSRRGARTRFQRTSSIAPSTTKLNASTPECQRPAYRHSDSIYTSPSASSLPPTTITNNNNDNVNDDSNKYSGNDSLETAIAAKDDQSSQFLPLSDTPMIFGKPQTNLDPITSPSQPSTINDQPLATNNLSRTESANMNQNVHRASQQSASAFMSTSNITHPSPIDRSSTEQQTTVKSPPRERKSSWSWSFWSDEKKSKTEQPSSTTTITTTTSSSPSSAVTTSATKNNREIHQGKNDDGFNKAENTPPPMTTSSSTPTSKQRFGFSSLFSRKASSSTPNGSSLGLNGKSVIGTNDEKTTNSTMMMVPPKDFQLNKINHQHRLPIHVERAVYRLSHMKLANPRRPLHDQVIISNFMFWYLTIISEQQQNRSHHPSAAPQQQQHNGSINSDQPSTSSRHSPPRTPQQIVTASKNKKKRLTKKSNQQKNSVPSLTTISSSASSSSSTSSVSSHHTKHSSSTISQKASSYEQYQQHHPLSSSPPPQQHHHQPIQDKSSWQHYIDGSSKQSSTGFVIPENYLRPSSESNLNDSSANSIHSNDVDKRQRHYRQYIRRSSSSGSDDDDVEDDNDDDEDDDDDDYDDYDSYNKKKNNKSFYGGSKSSKEKTAKQMSKQMKKQHHHHHHHNHQQQHRMVTPPIPQPAPSSS